MSVPARQMRRADRLMDDAGARSYLRNAEVCYIATVGTDGWPYVIPMCFIYDGERTLWFHHGNGAGHFLENLTHENRICLSASERGALIPGLSHPCQSSQEYAGVVAFGRVERVEDDALKIQHFDDMMAKYGPPGITFPDPTYRARDRTILWKMTVERVTGKRSTGDRH